MFRKKHLVLLLLLTFAFNMQVFSAKKSPINVPTKVQQKINKTEETSRSWYICELKNKTKAGKVIIGPVESRELILLVWIANSCKPDNDFCIAKNKTYITKNPEKFFPDEFARVKKDISELGVADCYEQYFFTDYLTRALKLTISADEFNAGNESEEPEVAEAPAPVEEQKVIEEQPKVVEEQPKAVEEPKVSETPKVEEEPKVAEEPAPVPVEEPKIAEAPEVVEEPAPVQEPVIVAAAPQQNQVTIKSNTPKNQSFSEPQIAPDGSFVYDNYYTSQNDTVYSDSSIDIDELKNELKNQLKDELIYELRSELQKAPQQQPAAEVKPAAVSEPTPVAVPEPTPVAVPEPTPVVVPEPEPLVVQEEAPVVEPEPAAVPEPETTPVVESEPAPVVQPETVTASVAPETPAFELPVNANTTTNSVKRYQKESLLDYAPKKTPALPSDDPQPEFTYIANPNKADSSGCTLLMKAAKEGNDWEIKNLIKSGASVNLKDKEGWTALMYAVRYQENLSIVETLIDAGCDVKAKNSFNVSALSLAATYNNNPYILSKLLNYYSTSEKELTQTFILVLTDNSSSEYSKTVKAEVFLEKSISLNSFYNGKTPLMYAAQYCSSTAVIKKLLEYGASPSIRSADGKTAFDFAKQNSSLPHDETYWALNRK